MPFKSLEKTLTKASALMRLIDGFTGQAVALPVEVRVTVKKQVASGEDNTAAAEEVDFVSARPGEYGFVDLASGEYEIWWGSQYFFPPDKDNPETFTYKAGEEYKEPKVVTLRPKPCYPFPPGATLLRGVVVEGRDGGVVVKDRDGKPVPVKGAAVYAVDHGDTKWEESESKTNEKGEFVLFFEGLKKLETENEKEFGLRAGDGSEYYVVAKGGTGINLKISVKLSETAEKTIEVPVAAGRVNTLGVVTIKP